MMRSRAMEERAAVRGPRAPFVAATSTAPSASSYAETKSRTGAPAAPRQNGMLRERVTAAWGTLLQSPETDTLAKGVITGGPTIERATVRLTAAQADAFPARRNDDV
jgi:hypothetical protein